MVSCSKGYFEFLYWISMLYVFSVGRLRHTFLVSMFSSLVLPWFDVTLISSGIVFLFCSVLATGWMVMYYLQVVSVISRVG
jgi:hypothetical protein